MAALTGRALFAAAAPRLERAHRERRAELRQLHSERRFVLGLIHKCEQRIAHRELQEVRALATGDRRYMARRTNKLKQAEGEHARLLRRLARVDAQIRGERWC